MKFARYCLLLFLAAALGGCASLGRGIVEAVLEAQNRESEDTRMCAVEGVAFTGMAPLPVWLTERWPRLTYAVSTY